MAVTKAQRYATARIAEFYLLISDSSDSSDSDSDSDSDSTLQPTERPTANNTAEL